jgi:sugar phosphate isomerase/epimerase
MISRRQVLIGGVAAAFGAAAKPLGLPIGLQLYSVRDDLGKDFDGTLRRLAAMGYEEVELAGLGGRTAIAVRDALKATGLTCRSAHYNVPELESALDRVIEEANTLGLKYIVCAFPRFADRANITLDEWKWNVDFFNRVGAICKAANIQFAYHNHNLEFRTYNGVTAYDELIRLTDAALVKLEMDCGWVATAGHDPAAYLMKHLGRFRLLHVKDLKAGFAANTDMKIVTTDIGSGTLDWKKIFTAAKAAGVEGYFVELEPPFAAPPLELARRSAAYLRGLAV